MNSKKVSLLLDKHLLISNFQLPKTCQDQRLKIRVNKMGPSWPVSTKRVWPWGEPVSMKHGLRTTDYGLGIKHELKNGN